MADQQNIAYFNTLIFTIVTGIVSLAVLTLLFFEFGQNLIYFIVIFEVGVFILIGICIYTIVSAERNKKKREEDILIKFDKCPDLYSKVSYSNENYCMNWYATNDVYGNQYVVRIYPLMDSQKNNITPVASFTSNDMSPSTFTTNTYQVIKPSQFASETKFKSVSDRCQTLFTKPLPSFSNNAYDALSLVPWTYARSRCASLVSGS